MPTAAIYAVHSIQFLKAFPWRFTIINLRIMNLTHWAEVLKSWTSTNKDGNSKMLK